MKERAAHFCEAQITVQLVQIFPNKNEVPLKRRNQEGSWDQLWPVWFCWLVLSETHFSLKSLYTQVRLHLTIKDILASLSAKSGLPFMFKFSFTRPMKEIEQNFPGGKCCLAVGAATFSLQRKSGCLPVSSSHQIILLLQYHEAIFILCTSRCSEC